MCGTIFVSYFGLLWCLASNIMAEVSASGISVCWLQYTEHVGQAPDRNKMYIAAEVHNYVSEQKLKTYLFEILLTWSYLIVRLHLHVSLLSSASCSVFSCFPASLFTVFSGVAFFFSLMTRYFNRNTEMAFSSHSCQGAYQSCSTLEK